MGEAGFGVLPERSSQIHHPNQRIITPCLILSSYFFMLSKSTDFIKC
jgi:hypothetical protein